MSNYFIALAIGCLAGAHAATWGMYKDAVYEGFSLRKYLRSVILAGAIAPAAQWFLHLDLARAGSLVLLFGITYVAERALMEFYKTFLREEDQSKYFIPMALSVRGRVVTNRVVRRLTGVAYLVGVGAVLWGIDRLGASSRLPAFVLVALAGSAAGWLSALGGAWKDAPLEGFQLFKFFRSPLVAFGFALLLAPFTRSLVLISLAALGFTVATIETYKKFFSPWKAPGKFAGKAVLHPEMYRRRRGFVPVYVAIWTVVLALFAAALVEPAEGIL